MSKISNYEDSARKKIERFVTAGRELSERYYVSYWFATENDIRARTRVPPIERRNRAAKTVLFLRSVCTYIRRGHARNAKKNTVRSIIRTSMTPSDVRVTYGNGEKKKKKNW